MSQQSVPFLAEHSSRFRAEVARDAQPPSAGDATAQFSSGRHVALPSGNKALLIPKPVCIQTRETQDHFGGRM